MLGIVLAAGGLSGAGATAYYYGLQIRSEEVSLTSLPIAPAASDSRRLLVLSPHCDDETLGVGGQIADARHAGMPVTVAFFTNGDAFRVAASRSLLKVDVGPADFVRFAELRQRESLAAMKELGVPPADVKFLGYPDRGLRPMWETNWDAEHPYRSGFTNADHSPYARTFAPNTAYCGVSLVNNLVSLLETVRPTDIMVTHPADDHPDHSAAASFTEAALRECQTRGDRWAQQAHLHYYIVHRGDWPIPQNNHPDLPLLPPPGLVTNDSRWTVAPLSDFAQKAKARALAQYASQLGVTGRFLKSFVRTNELYTDLPVPDSGHVSHPGSVATGTGAIPAGELDEGEIGVCETAAANLYGDSLARYVEPAGDITDLSVQRGSHDDLIVRLRTRKAASRMIQYTVCVRGFQTGPDGAQTSHRTVINLPVTPSERHGSDELTTDIPFSDLGLDQSGRDRCVWVSAESAWMDHMAVIDQTGYREFRLNDITGTSNGKPLPRKTNGRSAVEI